MQLTGKQDIDRRILFVTCLKFTENILEINSGKYVTLYLFENIFNYIISRKGFRLRYDLIINY